MDLQLNPFAINRDHPTRKIGMGRLPGANAAEKQASFKKFLATNVAQCPTYNLPVLDNVTLHFDGPLNDTQISQTFGNVINPLGANPESPPPGCQQVDTTFAEPGKFQTFNLICAIQWRLDFEPQAATILGNAWTAPSTAIAMPVSPDDFQVNGGSGSVTADDVTGAAGANSPLGLVTGQTMVQAALEWAWWAELAGFYQARGFNLQWQWGNRQLILNDQLRFTAYTPSNAMDGSASNSNVDTNFFVRRTNNYYRNILGASQIFLTADRSRIGNMNLGQAGQSVFRATRAYEFVGATYGGVALRQFLRGNNEFRRLSAPFLIAPGVPIGLKAVQSNTDDSTLMRQYLSATYGLAGSSPAAGPAIITPDVNVLSGASIAGTSGTTGVEPSLDATVVKNSIQLNSQRSVFKGGTWKLTVAFKGFELTPDQAQMIQDPDFQSVLKSECGCSCYMAGQ